MEADWTEVANTQLATPRARTQAHGASTAIAFDTFQGLLWNGNEDGRITAFLPRNGLSSLASFFVKPRVKPVVHQILFTAEGVITITRGEVRLTTRGGLTTWKAPKSFTDLRCGILVKNLLNQYDDTQYPLDLIVSGNEGALYRISIKNGHVVETIPTGINYQMFRLAGRYVCAATSTGAVHILDPNSLKLLHEWKTPSGWISDMDANSEYIVTCGCTVLPGQTISFDRFAYAFDLRQMQPLSPVPFQIGAAYVRLHPRMSSTGIVVSRMGQMQTIDVMNPHSIMVRHTTGYDRVLTGFDLSPSGEAVVFSDEMGGLRMWASPNRMMYADFGPVEYAPAYAAPHMDWAPEVPLNSVGMSYYYDALSSAWAEPSTHEVGEPARAIDSEVRGMLSPSSVGHWAPNPRRTLPNQAVDRSSRAAAEMVHQPPFLSEKSRDNSRKLLSIFHQPGLAFRCYDGAAVPPAYRRVEISYSRFGVDDFDFRFYNPTAYSGLETHITNSYANALLQLYRFIPAIRNMALQHTAQACDRDDCLLCEFGFLTDNLEKAAGLSCQATNFLRVFGSLPHTDTLGLLEDPANESVPVSSKVQSLNQFLSEKFITDFRTFKSSPAMDELVHSRMADRSRCTLCEVSGRQVEYEGAHDMVYPPPTASHPFQPTFSRVLAASIEHKMHIRGWCGNCSRYQIIYHRFLICQLSTVLLFNTAIVSDEAKQMWLTPGWLPKEVGIMFEGGRMCCYEGAELEYQLKRRPSEIDVYSLVGFVSTIHDEDSRTDHLVSVVNVGLSSSDPASPDEWMLFNDFVVQPLSAAEAFRFDASWKLPTALALQAKSHNHFIDNTWKTAIDVSPLYDAGSMSAGIMATGGKPISPKRKPHPGMTISIDSEFVSVQKEEFIVKASGERTMVRPTRLALGRLSVLRGSEMGGRCTPLIDDYVTVSENIVDHLTAYSGISEGDLDPDRSRHKLVSLKTSYRKLWILLNRGCVFVGHGLSKDFRTINIHVPRAQVVDTVDLFFLPNWGGRKLNLRFLAWLLLDEDIQTGSHDSIEDARTAFLLWCKYQEFVDDGNVDDQLEWVYSKGRSVGWRAPSSGSTPSNGSVSPPAGHSTPMTSQVVPTSTRGSNGTSATSSRTAPRY